MATLNFEDMDSERLYDMLRAGHRIAVDSDYKALEIIDMAEVREIDCYKLAGAGRFIIVAQ